MKKLCMEKKVFPEAEAEILCFGRVREEKIPNPAAGVAILRRSCYCKGTEKSRRASVEITFSTDEDSFREEVKIPWQNMA